MNSLHSILSSTAMSNLYTMGVASKTDARQTIPENNYHVPSREVRLLRAQLIFEEAMETIHALGCYLDDVGIRINREANPDQGVMEKAIDGCCDTIYVAVGTLIAMGVPDQLHLELVNLANIAKFPRGVGITNADGKFLKPLGWMPPDHQKYMSRKQINLNELSNKIVKGEV